MVIEEEEKMTVKELMTPNIVSVEPSTTIQQAAKLLEERKVGSVVVIDQGNPVGILTERDFAIKIALKSISPDTKVSEVMSSPVIHVSLSDSASTVIEKMSNNDIRKIPVFDDGEVVGIVTSTDFLRLYAKTTDEDIQKIYQAFIKRIYSKWFSEE